MCRELAVARPDCLRMSVPLLSTRSLHLAPARESGLELCFHTDSSREFMDLDCTQQGILFSDERKNIQQPVFALGVLDTLLCFGIRHMQVVGVERLSGGQKHSSPCCVPGRGWGARRGGGRPQLWGEKPGSAPSPELLPLLAFLPPPPHPQASHLPLVASNGRLGLPPGAAPAWGLLTARPVEYCISWL